MYPSAALRNTPALFARATLVALLLCALVASVWLGWAAHLYQSRTLDGVSRATRFVPFNADYVLALTGARPGEAATLLDRALALNPWNADAWIQRGFHAEMKQRDLALAERCYLRAAQVNRMYLPRWTLANFYLRQNNLPEFLHWAHDALVVTPVSPEPLFDAAWSLTNESRQILSALPDRSKILFEYVNYLAAHGKTDLLESAADRALSAPPSSSSSQLMDKPGLPEFGSAALAFAEDRLLSDGLAEPAMRIARKAGETNWSKLPGPSWQRPLTNASFGRPISGHGFDWVIQPLPGVMLDQYAELKRLRLTFSGKQPESCQMLRQYVPLAPGAAYTLEWTADTSDFTGNIGLAWRLYPVKADVTADAVPQAITSPDLVQPRETGGRWTFQLGPQYSLALLALEYHRPLGQVRAEGALTLHDLRMQSVETSKVNPQ